MLKRGNGLIYVKAERLVCRLPIPSRVARNFFKGRLGP